MHDKLFLGHDPAEIIRRARLLAGDIERLLAEGRPSDDDLDNAPILDRWIVVARIAPALAGAVTGHPVLDNRSIITSDLFALDADAGWARTAGRFYRLGRPGGAARGRDQ
ncbi:hypothetical protein EDE12_1296 [Methylosinus sp. sav-2]|nr:hypothetical protein EDE12_1296 [Methylosinus sp. sav-2]